MITAMTPPIAAIGGRIAPAWLGATAATRSMKRTNAMVEAIITTTVATSAPPPDVRVRRAALTVVAVELINPPNTPPSRVPALAPKARDSTKPARLMVTMSTTMNQISRGLRT